MGKYTCRREHATHDDVAQLAYYLYETRGRHAGHHIEDWLLAEQELTRHCA
jgi:Protein of unknown function (DUF2934)